MYGTKSAELHARVPVLWGSPDILQCTLVSFPTIRFRFSPPWYIYLNAHELIKSMGWACERGAGGPNAVMSLVHVAKAEAFPIAG